MGCKIHHPIAGREKLDQTGLRLCGRHEDGRYLYRNVSVMYRTSNVIALTQEQRIGLALCKNLALLTRPDVNTKVYVMTMSKSAKGYGSYNQPLLWLQREDLGHLGKLYLAGKRPRTATEQGLSTLAHEMGHNTQVTPSKPHGPEFDRAHIKMRHALLKVLRKGWKIDLRKLRDTVAPHLAKKVAKQKRREVAASETRTVKWQRKLAAAERNYAKWLKTQEKAERMVAKWGKEVRHSNTYLVRAIREEQEVE